MMGDIILIMCVSASFSPELSQINQIQNGDLFIPEMASFFNDI